MRKPIHEALTYHPGISMHHIPVGSDLAGFLFVLATVFVFGVGLPVFIELLVITGTLGMLASGIMLYWHNHHALKIQTLDLQKRK